MDLIVHAGTGKYTMFAGVPGWDIPAGDVARFKPGGNTSQQPARCAAACDKQQGCVAFTMYLSICYLKRNSGRTATFTLPDRTSRWRWLYYKDGALLPLC
jgi:hypothetical protein